MDSVQRPLRIIVLDRRRLVREGLAALLDAETEIAVVAAVERPDEVAALTGQVDIVLWGDSDDPSFLPTASVRLRDESLDALLTRLTRAGEPPVLAEQGGPQRALTPRETQIMRGVADGLSTGQIGDVLGISQKTVENHKQRIFAKLGVQSQAHAVMVSLDAGTIEAVRSTEIGLIA